MSPSELYETVEPHMACTASNLGRNVIAKHMGSCNNFPLSSVTFDNKSKQLSLLSKKLPKLDLVSPLLGFGLYMKGQSVSGICLPKLYPVIWMLCSRLPSSFLFNEKA